MKSLTHIIAVLIVVNWALAGYVLAQDSPPAQLLQAEEALAQKQAELAVKAGTGAVAQRAAQVMATDAKLSDDYAARVQADIALQQAQYSLAPTQATGGAEPTTAGLLVLTSPPQGEDLANVTLDLNIMSRILDNKLGRAQPAIYGRYERSLAELDTLLRRSLRAGATQTQAMYVQGYAAIFFIDVDFPLSPPQAQAEKVKEGADRVWEQTKWEVTASNKDLPLEYMRQQDAAARQYDKDVVEQLKTNLVKTLKHAANIRNLKPDEWVILVVVGTRPGVVVAEHGDEQHRFQYILSGPSTKGETSPSILTIRAKKADIDAHSADKIDYDQFRQRSQILTSRASLGSGQAQTRSWPSQNLRR
jgi:hypothetical protein